MERPLFWVVLLQSASSLAQQQLCGEYLVVGLPLHDRFEVAQCCSHERSNLIREYLNGRTGELVGRPHELRDTLIGLFGVKLLFLVEGPLAEHLVIRLSLTGPGVFSVFIGHVPPFLAHLYNPNAPDKLFAIEERKMSMSVLKVAELRFLRLLGSQSVSDNARAFVFLHIHPAPQDADLRHAA
jgi:hypothetical protein